MAYITFTAQDTLFFRDGRPFNQGEGTAGNIVSRFPPSPQTLVGSVRAAWARKMGWSGIGKWSAELLASLGGDEKTLANGIAFKGPFILKNNKPIFPAPALLIGKASGTAAKPEHVLRLRPSDQEYTCDLGAHIRLPVPAVDDKVEGRKLLQGWWLTGKGMAELLAGGTPGQDDFLHENSLWRKEIRTGIQLNRESGTTEEGALYTISHIRPMDAVSIGLLVENPPAEIPMDEPLRMVLGGEARSACITLHKQDIALPGCPDLPEVCGKVRYTVVVLSPLLPKEPLAPGKPLQGLPGILVSACQLRTERWGGWDTIGGIPLSLQSHLAPGSVLFMEAGVEEMKQIIELHFQTIGIRRTWGFGLIAIGCWN